MEKYKRIVNKEAQHLLFFNINFIIFIGTLVKKKKVLTNEELTIARQRSRDILSLSFTHLRERTLHRDAKDAK